LRAAARMVAGRRNWMLLEACGWGGERRGGVPAFYRPRRSVLEKEIFSGEEGRRRAALGPAGSGRWATGLLGQGGGCRAADGSRGAGGWDRLA
jgi:hypothetical protein